MTGPRADQPDLLTSVRGETPEMPEDARLATEVDLSLQYP
jgi:hypothetical protein